MLSGGWPALTAGSNTTQSELPLASCPGLGKGGAWRSKGKGQGKGILEPCSPAPTIWSDMDLRALPPTPVCLPHFLFHQRPPWGPKMPTNSGIGELNTCDSFRSLQGDGKYSSKWVSLWEGQ